MYVVIRAISVIADRVERTFVSPRWRTPRNPAEPGNALRCASAKRRSDARFTLYEVYHDEAGFKSHQQTPHHLLWRQTVADMMANPRVGKNTSLFPPAFTKQPAKMRFQFRTAGQLFFWTR